MMLHRRRLYKGPMIRSSVFVSVILALLFSPPQEKEKWQRIYNWQSSAVDISTSNVELGTEFTGRVRIRFTLNKPEPLSGKAGTKYKSVIETVEFNCPNQKYRLIDVKHFDSKGNEIDTDDSPPSAEWKTADRGGLIDKLFDPACKIISEKMRKL